MKGRRQRHSNRFGGKTFAAKKPHRPPEAARAEVARVPKEKMPLVLGRTPREDAAAVMRAFGLPARFPKGVLAEARRAAAETPSAKGRLDLRKTFVFTCDPETAKDFDDALSLTRDREGRRVLGVHIADVSHFVRPGSALDREAYARGNSVYLIDRVVPMLPEELSNGACSLVPNEDRLAFSAFLTFDGDGRMVDRRFAKSVIRSQARFTYAEVLKVLEGRKGAARVRGAKTLREISDLAQQIRRNRFAAGALDLAVPEMEIRLNARGELEDVAMRVTDVSHEMVEECMVAANEAVAKELKTRGIAIPARLHEPPDPERMEELRGDLAALGVRCGDLTHGKNTAAFLKKIKGHPLESVIAVMVLRSMKRAEYNAEKIGHFGLAKAYYAHFTSPIRRYPDLILHRQLAAWLGAADADDSFRGGRAPQAYLKEACLHLSETEERAADAERMLDDAKKFRYLETCGEPLEAVVSRVMPFGLFVDVPSLCASGLVHISHLSHRFVRYDEAARRLSDGVRSWEIGGKLTVLVLKVDRDNRWVDFTVCPETRRG